jgi:hypothetical protein
MPDNGNTDYEGRDPTDRLTLWITIIRRTASVRPFWKR